MDEYDGMLDGWRDNAYTFFTSLALFTGGFISPGLDAQEQDVSDRPAYEAESERYKKNAEEDSNKRSIQAVGVDNEDMIEDISFGAPPAAGELDLTLYNEDRLENMKEKVESMKERSRNDELSSKKRETALDALWEAVHRYREIDPYQYFREKFPDRRTKEEELDEYISERLEEVPHKTREYRVYLPSDYSENVTQEKLDSLDLMEKRHIKLYLDAFEKVENRKEIGMLIGKDLHPGNVPVEGLKEDGSEGFFQFTANSSEIIGKVVRGEGLIDFQPADPRRTIDNNSAFYNLEVFLDEYLADFHLHATLLDGNERFAGPSLPDLMSSDSVNKNSLALTYFPHQGQVWFNADYYRRKGIETEKEKRYDWNEKIHMVKDEGVVIDLGSYPTGRSMDWLGAKVMRESLRDMYFPSEKDFLDLLDNH